MDETNAAPKEEDTSELMAKIKAITVENLPEEVKAYTVNDFTDDKGIRHIEAVAGVDGIGHVSLELDAAALPQEDIHWMRLYTRLLGKLDTDKHTKEELDVLIDRYMYDKVTGVDCVDLKDSIHPYLVGEWYALDDDLATGYDLMEELLFHTRFDDVQKLLEQVQAQKTSVRATINNNAYSVMLYRGLADKSPFYLYYSYLNFLVLRFPGKSGGHAGRKAPGGDQALRGASELLRQQRWRGGCFRRQREEHRAQSSPGRRLPGQAQA